MLILFFVDIHNPNTTLCKKRGYPLPIVKHDDARKRALDRFKKAKGENEHQ
jgi:deoxyribodipyrimidine photo-lyase